jgi:signal transduction histidine kinase
MLAESVTATRIVRPVRGVWGAARRLSLAWQFALGSLLVFIAGMFGVGYWVADQIEQGVVHRSAATTALYMDSFVAPHLQSLATQDSLSQADTTALSSLLTDSALGQQIAAFKVWDANGRVLYSSEAGVTGQVFAPDEKLRRAWTGNVAAGISDLSDEENVVERQHYAKLLEIYTPVRQRESDRIIAVAELYQPTADLDREIGHARRRSWLVVDAVLLAMFLLLVGFVRRASDTIERQRGALNGQVTQLRGLLVQNADLNDRVRRAAARTTALNERFLRRFSAELHDGPAQELSLALLRLDHVIARSDGHDADLAIVQHSLQRALSEVRATSTGLLLPELSELSLSESLARVVREHERRTGSRVAIELGPLPEQAPLPVKIAAFRLTQEALNNAWRHAAGAGQRLAASVNGDAELLLAISDTGPGLREPLTNAGEHLGLLGMRERVESLGGHFQIESAPGRGTRISARLPLRAPAEHDAGEAYE